MSSIRSLFSPWCHLLGFLLLAVGLGAQDLGALRARMQERLPQLDALKAQGAIGEANDGLVALRSEGHAQAAALVPAENADRRAVYRALAERTGATAEAVGQARARQIAANSAPGVWLQDESGRWYRK